MRVAFYAPLKVPSHGTPSGDRRVAALYVQALQQAGHRVELASSLSSYDGAGSPERQAAMRLQGMATAEQFVRRLQSAPRGSRPDLWFTYHVYYKAPDWLGPHVSKALGIPYVIAEASYAPKRACGPWDLGHKASGEAIRLADLLVSPTRFDLGCLEPLVADGSKILLLPPFLDMQPFDDALEARPTQRARLAAAHRLDASIPWIVVAAMMREGDKAASYRQLADTLARISDLPWQLLVAGDGRARPEVARALESAAPGRVRLLGTLAEKEVAALYAAGDLCIWPACNEAYGMAMLEAQAAAVPVISCAHRGVPDVVVDGRTGLLAPAGDSAELARLARELLLDPGRRAEMGRAARQFVAGERSLKAASERLDQALARLGARSATHPAARLS